MSNPINSSRAITFRVTERIYQEMCKDLVEQGDYSNISQWVLAACKDFLAKRTAQGGGGPL